MTTLLLLLVYIFPEVNAFVGRSRLPASRLSCSSRATLCSAAFAAPADGMAAASPEALKVLYDGKCMVCLTNKRVLTLFDRAKTKLNFVNIQDKSYSPAQNGGILFEDAMRHFHVIDAEGTVHEGSDAVLMSYSAVGLGWLMAMLRFPPIRVMIDLLYRLVSRYRFAISRWLPGGRALAEAVTSLNDVQSAAQGYGCDDEDECILPDDDEDEDDA
uniref:Thiol-disulfide oxidoreductase DCC n=1 Tax=Haptolina ericina TaxID=156174 RepID=A0A7S3BUR6_9EUKA|mmetsp:Transcript_68687/g.153242  ORF Transcript_68687/g.153242 Transcript_68687/m.153242 type:complete len:215 (+) Transcript_68687:156-800(+)|eukprot:CAMPEP_0181204650 /NCGR_PEP_ID=MMETSP1096-20121128/20051_1 /TAXON_ID=156174 ORGANISM="Chrysochromulina ericina, Strain CCMP281" /NCGR_SAMPLE_ID=MMETSP1096 /ASSEMBLY_ACC=CAM_ASM_000453 /LENGTH=214 /DNA_ID=CAMNT_0023295369 /DNA_START=69 /DNA_END=713 /DNA_ORIENTATION=-